MSSLLCLLVLRRGLLLLVRRGWRRRLLFLPLGHFTGLALPSQLWLSHMDGFQSIAILPLFILLTLYHLILLLLVSFIITTHNIQPSRSLHLTSLLHSGRRRLLVNLDPINSLIIMSHSLIGLFLSNFLRRIVNAGIGNLDVSFLSVFAQPCSVALTGGTWNLDH